MDLLLEPKNGISLHQQIVSQLEGAILTGRLQPGERLPSVRDLSKQLSVNPLTVGKVYLTLEQKKLIVTQWGKGSFVAGQIRSPKAKSEKHLELLVERFLTSALPLVKNIDELVEILRIKALQSTKELNS